MRRAMPVQRRRALSGLASQSASESAKRSRLSPPGLSEHQGFHARKAVFRQQAQGRYTRPGVDDHNKRAPRSSRLTELAPKLPPPAGVSHLRPCVPAPARIARRPWRTLLEPWSYSGSLAGRANDTRSCLPCGGSGFLLPGGLWPRVGIAPATLRIGASTISTWKARLIVSNPAQKRPRPAYLSSLPCISYPLLTRRCCDMLPWSPSVVSRRSTHRY